MSKAIGPNEANSMSKSSTAKTLNTPSEAISMSPEAASTIILEHYRGRKHFGEMAQKPGRVVGEQVNRACGDEITLYLYLASGTIADISYVGKGCSVCIASAEILCTALKGHTLDSSRELAQNFLTQMNGNAASPAPAAPPTPPAPLPGDVPALLTLKDFPIRKKCALMSWHIVIELLT